MDLDGLTRAARTHVQQITASNPVSDPLPTETLFAGVENLGLVSLVKNLEIWLSSSSVDKLEVFEKIIVLEHCLSRIKHDPSAHAPTRKLRTWVANAILPSEAFAEPTSYSADEIVKIQAMSLKGLAILSYLQTLAPISPEEPDVEVLTCLASFSDENDTWSFSQAQEQSSNLLEVYVESSHLPALLTGILQQQVKPLFAKSKNPAITQQGRRAIDPISSNATMHSDLDFASKPWKHHSCYIVTVFQWVLKQLKQSSVEENWPLIVPPLLALIDDSSIKYKVKGCNTLITFLQVCPSVLLSRTGLGEVFETAVTPCLLYLPSLTEETESLQMLKAAYPALISLALTRFADEKDRAARMKALDKILMNGVLKGYAHAGEHIRIGQLLVEQIVELLNKMGIDSVKHLKYLIPLLSANLAAPFSTAYPPLLQVSVNAMEMIIVNDWPRIPYQKGEILKGLILCWSRIKEQDEKTDKLENVQGRIEKAVRLLTAVLGRNINVTEEYQLLIDSDFRLKHLLAIEGQ